MPITEPSAAVELKRCIRCEQLKPLDDFSWRSDAPHRRTSRCKQCVREVSAQWYKDNRERASARSKQWAKDNPERVEEIRRRSHLMRTYGITLEEYELLHRMQGGVCAIPGCDATVSERGGSLHVDHCHGTGAVRGLLCGDCNRMLGLASDDPAKLEAMAEYLRQSPAIGGH